MSAVRIQPTSSGVRIAVHVQTRKVLAGTVGIPARAVTLVAGAGSRTKTVELQGITEDRVKRLLHL